MSELRLQRDLGTVTFLLAINIMGVDNIASGGLAK